MMGTKEMRIFLSSLCVPRFQVGSGMFAAAQIFHTATSPEASAETRVSRGPAANARTG